MGERAGVVYPQVIHIDREMYASSGHQMAVSWDLPRMASSQGGAFYA